MAEKQRVIGTWAGQSIIVPGVSELFGKRYIWLQDSDNTIYTLPLGDDDVPQLL